MLVALIELSIDCVLLAPRVRGASSGSTQFDENQCYQRLIGLALIEL